MAKPRNSGKLRITSIQTNIYKKYTFFSNECSNYRDPFSLSIGFITILQLKIEIQRLIRNKTKQLGVVVHSLQRTHNFVV